MATGMVCLVGEQAIPNVIGVILCERWIERPAHVACLISDDLQNPGQGHFDPKFDVVFTGIEQSLGSLKPSIWDIRKEGPISPYDLDALECEVARLANELASERDVKDVVVNFTGGTKLMALAAALVARNNGLPVLYVDTEEHEVIWWDKLGNEDRQPFDHIDLEEINVECYLLAYRVELVDPGDQAPESALVAAANTIVKAPGGLALAEELAEMGSKSQTSLAILEVPASKLQGSARDILTTFDSDSRLGLTIEQDGDLLRLHLDAIMQQFFFGRHWLELYTFDQVRKAGIYHDDIRLNAKIRWTGIERAPVHNELDVVASRGAHLLICECKTGKLESDHLYKLQVVGKRLGTYVERVLVTTEQGIADPDSTQKPRFVTRALTMDIPIIGAEELPSLYCVLQDLDKYLERLQRDFGLTD